MKNIKLVTTGYVKHATAPSHIATAGSSMHTLSSPIDTTGSPFAYFSPDSNMRWQGTYDIFLVVQGPLECSPTHTSFEHRIFFFQYLFNLTLKGTFWSSFQKIICLVVWGDAPACQKGCQWDISLSPSREPNSQIVNGPDVVVFFQRLHR